MTPSSQRLLALICLAPRLVVGWPDPHRRDDDILASTRRRVLQSLVTLGDYLYFEGGELSAYDQGQREGERKSNQMNRTHSISLTDSWDIETVKVNLIEKIEPGGRNGVAMWVDEAANKIYRWGGWFPFHNDARDNDTALWELNPDGIGGGEWAIREPSTSSDFDDIWMGGDGAWTSCDGRGFYIGGLGNQQTDSRFEADRYMEATPIPGQLTYDMASGNWHNDTIGEITGFSSPHGTHVRGRAMCSQDFGPDPLVFVLGGHQTELDLTSHSTFNDIMQVNFFNARDRTWHSQRTTAHNDDVPPKRVRFCAAGATGSNGTYDIFVYGGQDEWGDTLDDMWILSLPAFRWFRVDVESPKRYFHACTIIGNRQFLVSGGWEEENGWEDPDPWPRAMGILDMTMLRWMDGYNAHAGEYQSPQQVADWYEHNGTESVQWSSDAVRDLFSPEQDPPEESNQPSAGVIAGSVIGALAGVGLIGAAIWFFMKRRKRAAQSPSELHGDTHNFQPDGKTPPYYPAYSLAPSTELNHGYTPPLELPSENGRWELATDVERHELPGQYGLPTGHEQHRYG